MKKILCASLILLNAAMARENPFFSAEEGNNLPLSSNTPEHKPRITSMTYNFPDQARVLKEATFTFQNVDGSQETRRLEIDQTIDWRLPLILSQSGGAKAANGNNNTTCNANNGFIQISGSGKKISLFSKDPVIRYFTLSNPNSVLVDFKHSGTFEPFEKPLASSPYSKIKITNHGKFARAALTLDGHYNCKISKTEQGATVVCQ